MFKKILVVVLSIAIIVSFTPVITFAGSDGYASNVEYYNTQKTIHGETKEVRDGVKSFDYTFYDKENTKHHYTDVSDNAKITLDAKTIQGILTKDYDGEGTLLEKWANIGSAVLSYNAGVGGNDKYNYVGQDSYSNDFKPGVSGSNYKIDVREYLGNNKVKSQGDLGDDCVRTTGLCSASSLDQVRTAAGDKFAAVIDKDMATTEKALDRKDLDEALPELKDTNKTQAFYSLVASCKEPSCNKRKVNVYGICLYDFAVREIADDNIEVTHAAQDGYSSIKDAASDPESGVTYDEEPGTSTKFTQDNESALESEYEVSTTNSSEEAFHSTTSESYEYESENSIGNEVMVKLGNDDSAASAELTFTYGYRWQETWGSSKEEEIEWTEGDESAQTTHVEMPAHTSLEVLHESKGSSYTLPYNSPAELVYKVVVFNLSGDVYADNTSIYYNNTSGYKSADSTVFIGGSKTTTTSDGKNQTVSCYAADDLEDRWYNRDVKGYDDGLDLCYRYFHEGTNTTTYAKDLGVDWDGVSTDSDNGDITDVIENINVSRPILSQGSDLVKSAQTKSSQISELESLYPIDRVIIDDNSVTNSTYNILEGNGMNLPVGKIKALDNEGGVEYYDFTESLGHWKIKNEQDKATVKLNYDYEKTGKKPTTVTGLSTGSATLEWVFDDPDYILESKNGNVRAGDVDEMPEIIINVVDSKLHRTGSTDTTEIEVNDENAVAGDEPVFIGDLFGLVSEIDDKKVNFKVMYDITEKPIIPSGKDPDEYNHDDWKAIVDDEGMVKFTGAGTYKVSATVGSIVYYTFIDVKPEREIASVFCPKKNIAVKEGTGVNLSSYLKIKDQYDKIWTFDEWKNLKGSDDLKMKFVAKGTDDVKEITKQQTDRASAVKKGATKKKAYFMPNVKAEKYNISVNISGKVIGNFTVTGKHTAVKYTIPAGYCKNGETGTKCSECGEILSRTILPGYSSYYVSKLAVKGGKKSIAVSWAKQKAANQKKFTGYEVSYSTSKSMKNAKSVFASKSSKGKTIKKLSANKKYYVQVRTYKTVKGVKYFSKWSQVKTAKTKK